LRKAFTHGSVSRVPVEEIGMHSELTIAEPIEKIVDEAAARQAW
jgi:hypothetical protein